MMNASFALAFGAPVARFFGERVTGALMFMAFYLACGVLAALAYAVIPGTAENALIGASAAVSGLMGAAARIIAGRGEVGGILSRPVLGMGAAWVVLNLIFATVGASFIPGAGGAPVAWQAHLTGYVAGVLLMSPFAWLARRV
jgi:membrane associated rhomboid family serine protease